MRNAFAAEITKLAAERQDVVLLSGDIGNRLFNDYKDRFPERFFNCGVAEANMTGMAAGMALCGLRPITYTIAPFVTTRCLEQIRVDICYHNVPVIIVGVGGGLSYAGLGATHHSCEDIALMRVLPNMAVVCPGDALEVRAALQAALTYPGPIYLRLGKKNEPLIHEDLPEFEIGKGIVLHQGHDVCILSTGNILPTAMDAVEQLEVQGISVQAVSFHTVKPLDKALLTEVFDNFSLVITVEEHSILGGLGSSIAEWLAQQQVESSAVQKKARLLCIGTTDTFLHEGGNQEYARHHFGLTAENISSMIQQRISA